MSPEAQTRSFNVLVVDSHRVSSKSLEDEFRTAGCSVSTARSGKQGLSAAMSLLPDFMVVDLDLSDEEGLQFIHKIKSSDKTRKIPFIVMTGLDDPIKCELSKQHGAMTILHKPLAAGMATAFLKNAMQEAKTKPSGRRILVVDDSNTMRAITRHLLEKDGHEVLEAADGLEGWNTLLSNDNTLDMVITDINMPNMNGRQLIEKIRKNHKYQFVPVIVSTTISEKEAIKLFLHLGAEDYIVKPFATEEFLARIHSHLRVKGLYEDLKEANQTLAKFNETLERRVKERTQELKEANLGAIFSLATAAEAKDTDTAVHIHRIQSYSHALALKLGFPPEEADEIGYSSIMHDVGKIAIPDEILKKKGRLTVAEFEIMKTHTIHGEKILSGRPFFNIARTIARSHHEKWDGSGYPDGLARENIPICARIVAIADVFDSLTSLRPYKKAWTMEEALEEIINSSGRHFDPAIVKAWVEMYDTRHISNIYHSWKEKEEEMTRLE